MLLGNGDGQSVTLLKANLTTVTNIACKEAYGGKGLFSRHLCAYKHGKNMQHYFNLHDCLFGCPFVRHNLAFYPDAAERGETELYIIKLKTTNSNLCKINTA